MFSKKRLLSNYNELVNFYSKNHKSVKKHIEKRKMESSYMKNKFDEKVDSLNRLRSK